MEKQTHASIEKIEKVDVSELKISDIPSMDLATLKEVIKVVMARHFKITGKVTVTHLPEAEISQAHKEFKKNLQPVVVNDFLELQERSQKNAVEFYEMLGITRQRYYDIKGRDKGEVIKEVPLSLLIRLYTKLPSLIPKPSPTPLNVHEALGGDDRINFKALAIVLGRGAASSRRWKGGIAPSEISRPILHALNESDKADEILEIMIDNVYEEASVRGLTPFKDMGWNGTPMDNEPRDIPKEYLSLPTVDHRRVAARKGELHGWGAKELVFKNVAKRVSKKQS